LRLPVKDEIIKKKIDIVGAEAKKNIPKSNSLKCILSFLMKLLMPLNISKRLSILSNASCRIRTCGPLLRRQLLYPAELRKLMF
tara:strand:- start:251 stop:502 length:252 start_codon:yes stop_codon:yes gene_type:complete